MATAESVSGRAAGCAGFGVGATEYPAGDEPDAGPNADLTLSTVAAYRRVSSSDLGDGSDHARVMPIHLRLGQSTAGSRRLRRWGRLRRPKRDRPHQSLA